MSGTQLRSSEPAHRVLGAVGTASAIGYGSWYPGSLDDVGQSSFVDAVRHAVERGITFIDTADVYGPDGLSETLVGRAVQSRRENVVLSVKFGLRTVPVHTADGVRLHHLGGGRPMTSVGGAPVRIATDPGLIPGYLDDSLRRLGVDHVDLYSPHFPDPGVPIEEVVGAIGELVDAGKVRHIGLSNVNAELLRRAQAERAIGAVQGQYSLAERTPETDVLPEARRLGVGFVCSVPLARGNAPGLAEQAEKVGAGAHQLALAWLLHRARDVIPIPGMQTVAHVDSNLAALEMTLDEETVAALDQIPWRPDARPWLDEYRATHG